VDVAFTLNNLLLLGWATMKFNDQYGNFIWLCSGGRHTIFYGTVPHTHSQDVDKERERNSTAVVNQQYIYVCEIYSKAHGTTSPSISLLLMRLKNMEGCTHEVLGTVSRFCRFCLCVQADPDGTGLSRNQVQGPRQSTELIRDWKCGRTEALDLR